MTITTRLITFGATPVELPMDAPGICAILIEPLRSNTHLSYVGVAGVTNDGSGTSVIKELAAPPAATVPCDNYFLENSDSDDTIYPGQFWVHGTAGEKLKVTFYQN